MSHSDPQRIGAVVLSDLHLGETISLLTPFDPSLGRGGGTSLTADAPALAALAQALGDLLRSDRPGDGERPTLVLAGDALGLAYASLAEGTALLERFFAALVADGSPLFDRVLYAAGNHDHHVWELAREDEFLDVAADAAVPLRDPRHATSPTPGHGLRCRLLDAAMQRARNGPGEPVEVLYPNIFLRGNGGRPALIHHGHFAEDLYRFLSIARRVLLPDRPAPATVEALEEENFAWIDFLWSSIGRSGPLGKDLEQLFFLLRNREATRDEAAKYADRIAAAVDFPYLPMQWAESKLTETIVKRLSARSGGERFSRASVCGPETMAGLMGYVRGPCRAQLGEDPLPNETGRPLLLWGHTHKPFEKLHEMEDGSVVTVINTGGWTIDYPEPDPLRGASIVALSDDLAEAPIRIFNDTGDSEGLRCYVSTPAGAERSPFQRSVERRMMVEDGEAEALRPAWERLGQTLGEQIALRRRYLEHQRPE